MRKLIRDALAEVARQGATVLEIVEAGRHTEVIIEVAGRRSTLRLHKGSKVSSRAERALRSAIRGALRT